jgi:hypothetical protein
MEDQPVNIIWYQPHLLTNLANEPESGGTLVVDTYTFDPDLAIVDGIEVQDWRVGVSTETSMSNQPFSFSAKVMKIQKVAVRHQAFIIRIFLESLDRETIDQIRQALVESNPGQF